MNTQVRSAREWTRRGVGLSLLLMCAAAAPAAFAEPVAIELSAIRGTTKHPEFSPELKPLEAKLRKLGFTGAKLERRVNGRAEVGKSFEAAFSGDYRVAVTPSKRDASGIHMRIVIQRAGKTVLETNVTRKPGDAQLIVVADLPGGDKFVLAVSGG